MLAKLQQRKGYALLALVGLWFILAKVFQGRDTLEISVVDDTPVAKVFGEAADSIRGNRTKSAAFIYFFNPIRMAITSFVELFRTLISIPVNGAASPYIGWFGVIAIMAFICYATSRLRIALLSIALLLGCGALGMWQFTMDTIAMTIAAVLLSLLIGIPIGIWAGLSDRVLKAVTPILDLAQILPTLVYLAPLALFFMIGVAAATVATMVYSIPIAVRITSHAIRSLNFSPV